MRKFDPVASCMLELLEMLVEVLGLIE